MNQEVFSELSQAMQRGEAVALVTIVSASGSTPQRVGAKMLVWADGRTVGTIGGGCYENDAFGKARAAIADGRSSKVRYELSDDFAEESGLICGGQMEVFIEPLEPAPDVYIFGAGHVGAALARMAHDTGFRVHLIDDREKFADAASFVAGIDVVVADIPDWLSTHPLHPRAYAVVVTRGHRHDLDTLRQLVAQPLRYIGMIGSRAKVRRVFEALQEASVPPEALQHIHSPIGLAIGAVTPQEIAVSILAELIAVRHGRAGVDASSTPSLRWEGAVVHR